MTKHIYNALLQLCIRQLQQVYVVIIYTHAHQSSKSIAGYTYDPSACFAALAVLRYDDTLPLTADTYTLPPNKTNNNNTNTATNTPLHDSAQMSPCNYNPPYAYTPVYYYYGYRYYNPELGRWINRDPLHETASAYREARRRKLLTGPHIYAFVENSQITRYDVDGRGWFCNTVCSPLNPKMPIFVCDILCPPSTGGPFIPASCSLISFWTRTIVDKKGCCLKHQCVYDYLCREGHYSDEIGHTCEDRIINDIPCVGGICSNKNNNQSIIIQSVVWTC